MISDQYLNCILISKTCQYIRNIKVSNKSNLLIIVFQTLHNGTKTFSGNLLPMQKGITHFRNNNHSQTICFVFVRTISLFKRMSEKQLPKANKSKQNIGFIISYLISYSKRGKCFDVSIHKQL